jgi:DNA-binding CsgD family transcriptional regulator/PAS domain-containing protein
MSLLRDPQVARAMDLVGRVYEASADVRQWPAFLEAFAEATGSAGTVIWLHDFADASAVMGTSGVSFACDVGFEPGRLDRYAEHFTFTNPWMKSIDALPEGGTANSSDVYPDSQLRRTEFYGDWLKPQGLAHALGGPVLKRGTVVSMFSFLREEHRGPFGAEEDALLEVLMPHLRRACLLHQRLARFRAERAGALAALEKLPTAVWVIDAQGRLLFANAAGRDLDSRHDGLWIDGTGHPVAADPNETQALHRCIRATLAAGAGRGVAPDCAVSIRRHCCDAPLHVMLYPLGENALVQGCAAAMFIFDPSKAAAPDTHLLRRFYGLTPAEARLACALARGDSVEGYGAVHGLTMNTVRTHLKRALAKTGTHRQSQLVGLLASLPRTSA